MRQLFNLIVFFTALWLLCMMVLVFPPDSQAEEYENRAMAGFPALSSARLINGEFTSELESYLNDRVAFRTSLLRFASAVEKAYGLPARGAVLVQLNAEDIGRGLIPETEDIEPEADIPATTVAERPVPAEMPALAETSAPSPVASFTPAPAEEPAPASTEEPTPTPIPLHHVNPALPFSVDVQYSEDAVLYERYRENDSTMARYAEILNRYREALPENIRVFSLLSPIRVEFMGEQYQSANDSQRETIHKINALLNEGIVTVDAYGSMAAHTDEYIYFRTDHHWTALGAYYAYLAFAETAGFHPVTIDNYVERAIPSYLGSLGKGTQNQTILSHLDTLYYYELDDGTTFSRRLFYIPEDMSRLSYRIFMGGDYAKLDFTSSNENGRTLAVVKDSYANAFIPWVAPHYERIIVIDPRQFEGSVVSLLREREQVDLLFLNYTAAVGMSDFIETINNAL